MIVELTKSYQDNQNATGLYALYCDFLDGKVDVIVPGQPKTKDLTSLFLRRAVLDSYKRKD